MTLTNHYNKHLKLLKRRRLSFNFLLTFSNFETTILINKKRKEDLSWQLSLKQLIVGNSSTRIVFCRFGTDAIQTFCICAGKSLNKITRTIKNLRAGLVLSISCNFGKCSFCLFRRKNEAINYYHCCDIHLFNRSFYCRIASHKSIKSHTYCRNFTDNESSSFRPNS